MFTVRPYAQSDAEAWDALVLRSRNGNFLHRRGYMDYHADRFVDRSLIVERKGQAIAVFPANIRDNIVVSHGGLTYAGLIASHDLRAESALAVFDLMGDYYRSLGAERLIYKAAPHVFHSYPADEDLYALHRLGACLRRRDVSSVVSLQEAIPVSDGRRRAIEKARMVGITLQADTDLKDFHALLSEVLRKHAAVPTHSLDELCVLQGRFPQQITLHEARQEGNLLAAVLVYDFEHVVHTQYLAASSEGRRLNALSLLLADLMGGIYAGRRYFSLGISTEQEGRVLNGGLVAQKEYFGARAVAHDFYEWVL